MSSSFWDTRSADEPEVKRFCFGHLSRKLLERKSGKVERSGGIWERGGACLLL